MNKRQLALAYIVENYPQWPAKTTLSPGAATHHGYGWHKIDPNGPWALTCDSGDAITQDDHIKHYEDNVKMSDYFDVSAPEFSYPDMDLDDEITLNLSAAQVRAMAVALRRYDGMKAKLKHARKSVRQLTSELGE